MKKIDPKFLFIAFKTLIIDMHIDFLSFLIAISFTPHIIFSPYAHIRRKRFFLTPEWIEPPKKLKRELITDNLSEITINEWKKMRGGRESSVGGIGDKKSSCISIP